MRLVPRLALLATTLALPVGVVLASQAFSNDPIPEAPGEVRIGEPGGGRARTGQPSAPPGPSTGRSSPVTPLVEPQPPVEPEQAAPETVAAAPETATVPPAPPVADSDDDPGKRKAKHNNGGPAHRRDADRGGKNGDDG